jgi:hypothetical protein
MGGQGNLADVAGGRQYSGKPAKMHWNLESPIGDR